MTCGPISTYGDDGHMSSLEGLQTMSAELMYSKLYACLENFWDHLSNMTTFCGNYSKTSKKMRPTPIKRYGEKKSFIFKDLVMLEYSFMRHDAVRTSLQMLYDGPHNVISRGEKTLAINNHSKYVTVSFDWFKPAYILAEDVPGQDL